MWEELPIFKGVPPYEVHHALEQFQVMEVEAGTDLIAEGEDDPTLVMVVQGELEILLGGVVLGRARPGDLVGEIALFAGGLRTASARASTRASLLVLDQHGYEALRVERSPVSAALEEHALDQTTARLRKMRDRIASKAAGGRLAEPPPSGFFERVTSIFGGGGGVSSVAVDASSVLQKSALFSGVPRDLLEPVAARMDARQYRAGHFLCTEGEVGQEMFVICSGEVDVVCQTQLGGFEKMATLRSGDAFGMCSLVQPDLPRMASCIARDKVVALSLESLQWAEVIHGRDWVGSILRVAMIRALAESLAYANAQLAGLDAKQARSDRASVLMRAGAATEAVGGWMGDEARPAWYDQDS
jgi:CRP-like cAMP-binding protein